MLNHLKNKIHSKLLSYLFNAVTEDSFLQTTLQAGKVNGIILGKKRLTDNEAMELANDARFFKRSRLWKLLIESMQYSANENLFKKSQTVEDMIHAKATLYTLDVLEKKIQNISQLE
jgi:hypothetical protein